MEILKNNLENQQTENSLLKKQTDKQKKQISVQRSEKERLMIDMEFYKKNPKKRTAVSN